MTLLVRDQATFASPGKNVNEKYETIIEHIRNNNLLTGEEKDKAIDNITVSKDYQNLLFLKGPTYPCDICSKEGYTISFCKHCARETLQSKFSSGNDIIDNAIREAQIKYPFRCGIIEWIEYKDLIDVRYLAEGGCSKIYTATWTKGYFKKYDKEKKEFIRRGPVVKILKQLDNSHKPNKEFLNELIFNLILHYSINKYLYSVKANLFIL